MDIELHSNIRSREIVVLVWNLVPSRFDLTDDVDHIVDHLWVIFVICP
ncbi:hypothetical protein [Vibrio vulnificus YJ016]|uniref:Uncharacterized protein n=1 Tax=Vibrio vulnificus (strain YJ016) TaxID=196600 RepID=Q7MIN0_VIBVY|nr:hypothetical protein [Vibrio vulnificus YJ016]